ncbi:MAG: FG-GAP-like repeat-containing protein [Bacteroidota bacterium]
MKKQPSTVQYRMVKALHVAFLSVMMYSAMPAIAQITFQGPTSLNLPDTPQELAKGDLNNDGRMDFVSVNFNGLSNQQLTVMLNSGTGTFTGSNMRNFSAATNVLDVAMGDFNEDGNLDVVACGQSDNFSLSLGDGAGNLGAPTIIAAGNVPEGIDVGDLNKDGNLDVVISNRGSPSNVYIFLGNGSGGFAAPTIIPITNLTDIRIGDFNEDTNPDFAISVSTSVQIYTGDGTGTAFTPSTVVTGFASGEDLITADLNKDNHLDIIAGGGYTLGDGAGNFAPRVLLTQTNYEYAVGDVNKDGNPDIIASDNNVNYTNMRVFLGNGVGVFSLLAKFETNILFYGVEIADVNNDANPDVVGIGTWGSLRRVDVLLGDGSGYFSTVTKYPVASDPREMVSGDFNKDGLLDIALAFTIGNNISIHLGQGQGRFAKTAVNYTTGTYPSEMIVADYNKDGNQDLITNNRSNATITVLTGAGDGTFTLLGHLPLPANTEGIAYADFNKDTNPDIVASGNTANAIYILTGTGTGFNSAVTITTTANVYDIEAADFNSDGNPDLAASFFNTNRFLVLFGNGSGGFTEGTQYVANSNPSFIRVYDLNNDNKPDVLVRTSSEHHFINDGTGSFTGTLFSEAAALGSDYADIDGDGIKDLIYGSQNSISSNVGLIRAYKGSGTGTFNTTTPIINRQGSGGNQLITHDFNADGKLDIITTSFNIYEDYLATLINTTSAPTCNAPVIGSITGPTTRCVGTSFTLSVTATGDAPLSYQWRKNGADISGATSTSYTISSVVPADAANYSVRIANACGTVISGSIPLTISSAPSAPAATGASSCSAASLVLNASGGSNGDYRWYTVSTGGTAIPGEVNGTYTTPILTSTTSYYVSLINASGCESARTAVQATIVQLTKPTITATVVISGGSASICQGDNETFTAPNGFAVYNWSTGASTQQISVNQAGTYSVIVGDGTCTSPASDIVNVSIVPNPVAAITMNGEVLTASAGSSWQWYQNGQSVSGATSQTFQISTIEYGVYAVDITNNQGCTSRSPDFEYLITDVGLSSTNNCRIFPNPARDKLFVEHHDESKKIQVIELMSTLGNVLLTLSNCQQITELDLEPLSDGIFFLRVKIDNTEKLYRIIKIN